MDCAGENKVTVTQSLKKMQNHPLIALQEWGDSPNFTKREVGFCARWCLDNLCELSHLTEFFLTRNASTKQTTTKLQIMVTPIATDVCYLSKQICFKLEKIFWFMSEIQYVWLDKKRNNNVVIENPFLGELCVCIFHTRAKTTNNKTHTILTYTLFLLIQHICTHAHVHTHTCEMCANNKASFFF